MKELLIKGTNVAPSIHGDSSGNVEISGKSMMEDALSFYQPYHQWIDELIQSDVTSLNIDIDLVYFNSSSSKQLLKFLMIIDDSDKECNLNWFFPEGNEVLEDRGKEFEFMLDFSFNYIEKKT